jgi:hypothetical protein
MTDRLAWDDAVAAHTALLALHDQSLMLVTRLLSQASRAAAYSPDVLAEIAATRTEIRVLLEQQADMLTDLERALEALEPDEPPITVENR